MDVKALIRHTKALEDEIDGLMKIRDSNKAKIQEFFDTKGYKEILVMPESKAKDDVIIVAQKIEKCFVEYDMAKLKEKLDKDVFNKVVTKSYEVDDMPGVIAMLKENGVRAADFKAFIKVYMKPDKEAMKQLYAVGDLSKADLDGCYTAKLQKYIQIKEKTSR
jgi:hypothetical protein